MEKNAFQKILVIQTSFIGDVILATSVLEKLYQYYPHAKLDFLLRKGNENLVEKHPFLNKIYIWNKKNKYKDIWRILKEVRKENYDLVVNLQRFGTTGFLTAFSGAKISVGFKKNPFSWFFSQSFPHFFQKNHHEIDRNHQLIAALSDPNPAMPRLYPSKEDFGLVADYQQVSYICIAPSSVWFTKQFPLEKWVEFLKKLNFSGKVYLLGAKTDQKVCQELAQHHPNCEVLAGKLNLLQSAALMQKSLMNFVNDSSPLHLANAMNAPVTAIFCSTVADFGFYPISQTSFIVQNNKNLACRPCGLHGKKACPKAHFECGNGIEIQELLDKIPKN